MKIIEKFAILCVVAILAIFTANSAYAWNTFHNKDEMTGETTYYAQSIGSYSKRKMNFPYSNTMARLVFGCDQSGSEWAYMWFSNSPNITNSEARLGGYSIFTSRIKFDNKLDSATIRQDWGSNFLHFEYDSWAITNIIKSKKVIIEFYWHGNGKVLFEFDLNGASDAISYARKNCK